MNTSVDRITFTSASDLQDRYLNRHIPVVVTGYLDSWSALGKVTPDFIAQQWGAKEVPIVTMRDGDYVNGQLNDVPLVEYLESIGAVSSGTEITVDPKITRYMAQVSVAEYLPELLEEVERPPFFPHEDPSDMVVYVGGELFSQLHYHPSGSATLCMLHGQKRVRLFAPDQSRYLYSYPWYARHPTVSKTRHKHPDPTEFPEFSKAKYLDVTLSAGDLLFIPIYWWHSIENDGISISVVSFWSRGLKSLFLPPAGARAAYFATPAKQLFGRLRGLTKKMARAQ